jgi:hypothetical protein
MGLLSPPTLDSSLVTQQLIEANLVPLGTSSNAAGDFAVNFTLQGFEPLILAFPFDSAGQEITGEGTAGFASNVLIPEPVTSALVLAGLSGIGVLARRRSRRLNAGR